MLFLTTFCKASCSITCTAYGWCTQRINYLITCRALVRDRDRQHLSQTWCDTIERKVERSKQRVKQFAKCMIAEMPDDLLDYLDPFLPPKTPSTSLTTPASTPDNPLTYPDPSLPPKPNPQYATQQLEYSKLRVYRDLANIFAADSNNYNCNCQAAEEEADAESVDFADWTHTGSAKVPSDLTNMVCRYKTPPVLQKPSGLSCKMVHLMLQGIKLQAMQAAVATRMKQNAMKWQNRGSGCRPVSQSLQLNLTGW